MMSGRTINRTKDSGDKFPGINPHLDYPEQPADAPLRAWHELFHSFYQRRIDEDLMELGQSYTPVLVQLAGELILFHRDQEVRLSIAGHTYHRLKTLCHIPLAISLALAPKSSEPSPTADQLSAALREIATDGDDQGLLNACEQFLTEYRETGLVSEAAQGTLRTQYNRATRLLIQEASNEAVAALDEAIEKLESQVDNPAHWSELFCVVCSGHQPRYGELNKQYFEQYLQDRNIGDARWQQRLLYGEGLTKPRDALRLVAQRRVDNHLGISFLGAATGLNQDILAHAGQVALRRS